MNPFELLGIIVFVLFLAVGTYRILAICWERRDNIWLTFIRYGLPIATGMLAGLLWGRYIWRD